MALPLPNGLQAVLLFHINSDKYLFPMIQSWPTQSSSAETLLVRRDGNDALYLNELRHKKGTALNLRIPLINTRVPSVAAILNNKPLALEDGVDYRGIPVLAATHPVTGTPWHIVAKIDSEEVMAPHLELAQWIGLLTLIAVTIIAMALWQLWRQLLNTQRLEMTTRSLALQREEARYHRLYDSMRDAYVMLDMQGHLLDFNPAYREMLGYAEQELRSLTYLDLTPEKWRAFEARLIGEQVIPHGQSEVYEKEYMRRDGTVFPVELRTFLLRDKDGQPEAMWAIVRDITERRKYTSELQEMLKAANQSRLTMLSMLSMLEDQKRVDQALRESEEIFRNFMEYSPIYVFFTD